MVSQAHFIARRASFETWSTFSAIHLRDGLVISMPLSGVHINGIWGAHHQFTEVSWSYARP